ncbi:uncharacterized protein HD556DRAFT_1447646 [Suillus plorans]|uniref:Uncharacterized protein n=1 Tax=Suillus plorans TaxID=116603 RepID=A0A9P7DDY9_9AGAM|nr:uncharacterized protein HD556DRAFT_1447646 [Suillus plorans]KAG1788618.1 hypothetical protein HD556DRAFT_1447646 [Suillus plorans]
MVLTGSPQSFDLDEIHVCGKIYSQPAAFDRLHLDRESFLVDVIAQGNVYESLTISYSRIRAITMVPSNGPPPNKAIVRVNLTNPPHMGKVPLNVPRGQSLYLNFEIKHEDSNRFIEALRQRGVVQIVFSSAKLAGTKRKRDDAELPMGALKISKDDGPPRKKARADASSNIEAGVVQAVRRTLSEDVKPSETRSTDVDPLEDVRAENYVYSLLGDEYVEYSISLGGSESSIPDIPSDSALVQLTPPGKYPTVIDLTRTPTPTRDCQGSVEECRAGKNSWTNTNVGVQSAETWKASASNKCPTANEAEDLTASYQYSNPRKSINTLPKLFPTHAHIIDLTSDERHPEELPLPATMDHDGGRCALQEELSHMKSQLKQLCGKIRKLEQNNSLLQSAANCLSDFYRGWSNLVVLNVVKQPCEGVEDESVIYTCQYRYVGEEKKLDPEGMLVEKSLTISFSLHIFTDSEDPGSDKVVYYTPLKLPEANDQFNDHLGYCHIPRSGPGPITLIISGFPDPADFYVSSGSDSRLTSAPYPFGISLIS